MILRFNLDSMRNTPLLRIRPIKESLQQGLPKRNKKNDDFDVANGVSYDVASLSCWGLENVMFQSTVTFSMKKLGSNPSQTYNLENIHFSVLIVVNTI